MACSSKSQPVYLLHGLQIIYYIQMHHREHKLSFPNYLLSLSVKILYYRRYKSNLRNNTGNATYLQDVLGLAAYGVQLQITAHISSLRIAYYPLYLMHHSQ